MTLLALGINHKTAPVSLRERVTFSPGTIGEALDNLLQHPLVKGGVVLSTCNRTELYLSVEQQDNLYEQLIDWLCGYHQLNPRDLRSSIYWHCGNEAVSHLMRVASGLDSLVLGEPQILGQVKKRLPSRSTTILYRVNWSDCFRNRFLSPSALGRKQRSVQMRFPLHLPLVPWRGRFLNHFLN